MNTEALARVNEMGNMLADGFGILMLIVFVVVLYSVISR